MQSLYTIPRKFQKPDRLVFTGTVAHKMVAVASQQAEKAGTFVKHCHSSSACALNEALTEYFGGNA